MKRPIEGHIACPICDHPDAEVKRDKNGALYVFCPDCNAQVFTRGCQRKQAALMRKMRSTAQPEPPAPPEEKPEAPKPETASTPQPTPAKKRAGLLIG
jgi:uncharacterized Zn finger protein (UPF0148 family)